MKHAVFILSFVAPLGVWLLLFNIADRGLSFCLFGLLVPSLILALLAFTGLDLFEFRGRILQKKSSELAMRGALGGLALVVCTLAAPQLVSVRTAFYSSLALSIVLAPLALFVPFPRAKIEPNLESSVERSRHRTLDEQARKE